MIYSSSWPDVNLQTINVLQHELLEMAEQQLGQRDRTKIIGNPFFWDKNPCILHIPIGRGATACLSDNAAVYWPTAIYELAHETVHLLNPVKGNTNWLEEGVAVAFSLFAMGQYKVPPQMVNDPLYKEALDLAEALPGGAIQAGRNARATAGALGAVTYEHLKAIAPDIEAFKLQKLASLFPGG